MAESTFTGKKFILISCSWQLEQLDKPYLIGEVMEKSPLLTDRLYRRVLRISNRSVIETVHALEQEKQDYREYIESWIHEVKAAAHGRQSHVRAENIGGRRGSRLLPQNAPGNGIHGKCRGTGALLCPLR